MLNILNKIIVAIVQMMPRSLVWIFSKKYIAGRTLDDAVNLVNQLNAKGIYGTIDVLGEAIQNKDEAIEAKNECLKVLEAIDENKLKANLSLKPTQLGLNLDTEFAFDQAKEIVEKAEKIGNFVRLDMEDSPYTDPTINLYKKLLSNFENVGIVVQSYLKRTYDDVVLLNKLNTNYRLCKGIYIESQSIAYKDKQVIRDNYLKILEIMLKGGNYVGIATHDEYLIKGAMKLIEELKVSKDKFEFQMLLGVREDLRDKINADGFKIRIYIPFGEHWYKYSVRRLKENPSIAGHVFKNLFSFK
ncbi:MAG TPA: proline dehydrogenase family protein [Ignavibacteriaceae bacterium]|nr:proline dehydrogenase family protein [Ignavibacteriaceae bacterium]